MGLKENFSQAVKDLTGGSKDEEKKKNTQVSGLKRALGDTDDNQYVDEGIVSKPYYRDKPSDQSSFGQNPNSYVQTNGYDKGRINSAQSSDNDNFQRNDVSNVNYNRGVDNFQRNDVSNVNYNRGADNFQRNDVSNVNYNRGADNFQRNDAPNVNYNRSADNFQRNDASNVNYNRSADNFQRNDASNVNYNRGVDNFQRNDAPNVNYRKGTAGFAQEESGAAYPAPTNAPRQPMNDELTIISKNTVIDGNVRSFANMSIDGDIKGDVETTKNIELNGRIVGNMTCNNANMNISQIQGNVLLKGNVEIGRDTLLIGDLTSGFASINGKVKGNVVTTGKAEFKADAVVFGDISASTITVDDGAIIQGYVSTTFLNKEESVNIFPEAVTIDE